MAKWRTIGRATCGLLLVVSLICLGWTILPGARKQVKLVPAPLHFNNDTLALAEFQLDLPLTASQGGDDLLRLRMDATGVGTQHPVLVTARLELLSADLEPGAEIQIPATKTPGFTAGRHRDARTGKRAASVRIKPAPVTVLERFG